MSGGRGSGGRRRKRSQQPGALDSTTVLPPGPVRTCVGCRVRAGKTDLLRVVAVEGLLVPDPAGRMPGRGASVHRDPRCVDLAEKRRAFPRALRLPGPLDVRPLREAVQQEAPPQEARSQEARSPASPSREQVETA